MIELFCEYLSVRWIWLYVIIISRIITLSCYHYSHYYIEDNKKISLSLFYFSLLMFSTKFIPISYRITPRGHWCHINLINCNFSTIFFFSHFFCYHSVLSWLLNFSNKLSTFILFFCALLNMAKILKLINWTSTIMHF